MIRSSSLGVAVGLALLPCPSGAEVCLGTPPYGGYTPFLNGCEIVLAFEKSFGNGGVIVDGLPDLKVSESGRPQVVISLEFNDLVDVLDNSSRNAGGSLIGATSEFEARLQKMACAGYHDSFLNAGGSIRIALTAIRKKAKVDPLKSPTERFALIDLEIDTPKDCEAP